MKILFICGSLEPGRDGVGDYTRRLAGECIRQGQECSIIALNDKFGTGQTSRVGSQESRVQADGAALSGTANRQLPTANFHESQLADGTPVPVLRLPSALSWRDRMDLAESFLAEHDPDWISLQYVPYAFHNKGLPLLLPGSIERLLRAAPQPTTNNQQLTPGLNEAPPSPVTRQSLHAAGRPLHIMFHEIGLGHSIQCRLKDQFLGMIQSAISGILCHLAKSGRIHTHAAPYQRILRSRHFDARSLPIFTNIPIAASTPTERASYNQVTNSFRVALFGSLHPEFDPFTLGKFVSLVSSEKALRPVVLILGRHGRNEQEIESWIRTGPGGSSWITAPGLNETDLSSTLLSIDAGAVSSPVSLLEKSSAAAALREHGLPVICPRDDIAFPLGPKQPEGEHVWWCRTNSLGAHWLKKAPRWSPKDRLSQVTRRFIGSLQTVGSRDYY